MITTRTPATDTLYLAAGEALDRFTHLEASRERDPRLKTDQREWLLWHQDTYYPARRGWDQAIDVLETLLGRTFPEREAHEWKPVCIQILTGEHPVSTER